MTPSLSATIRRIRYVELELAARYPSDVIKSPMHLALGAEWVAAGICSELLPEDKVIGSYRSHALYLAKGGDLKAMLYELYGDERGCCGGLGGSMHLCDLAAGVLGSSAVVATQIPVALGWALAGHKIACFFGDGATEEGVFYESVNFAVLHDLPVLFVCENNNLAVDTPLSKRSRFAPIDRIGDMGIWTMGFDDGEKDLDALVETVRDWRNDPVPLYLECNVTRLCDHVGPVHDEDAHDAIFADVRAEVMAAFAEVERP